MGGVINQGSKPSVLPRSVEPGHASGIRKQRRVPSLTSVTGSPSSCATPPALGPLPQASGLTLDPVWNGNTRPVATGVHEGEPSHPRDQARRETPPKALCEILPPTL